jgi:hypothetical protein
MNREDDDFQLGIENLDWEFAQMMVVGGHILHLYHLLDAMLETDYRFGSIL